MSDLSVSRADMLRELNRGALDDFWDALAGSGKDAAKIYRNDAVLRTPQDGGQIIGRADIAAHGFLRAGDKLVKVNSILGEGGVWVSECEIVRQKQVTLLVSVAEMHDGQIIRETRYWAPRYVGSRSRSS